ncbi:MAG: 50S ribosomal protein L23 [Planctomycetota bacterium]|nr:MAG: 50S ribosomal protein L23 [Planctomycetota bacterium]
MPVHLDAYQVIKAPIITEKLAKQTEHSNIWGFVVDKRANKIQIKQAVEQLFDVKVLSVRTMNRKGKPRRVGREWSHAPNWKRALVRLAEDDRIE